MHNNSVNRSWLVGRFSNVVSFVYNSWCANVNSVGPPTLLPRALYRSIVVYQQFIFTFPDDFDPAQHQSFSVANAYVLTLPFRVRVGRFLTINVSDSFDVFFRNTLDIPEGTSNDALTQLLWDGERTRPREQFFTDVAVLDLSPKIPAEFREQLVNLVDDQPDQQMPESGSKYFDALTALNDAIVGYHHATRCLFGGTVVERFTDQMFFDRLRYRHTLIYPETYQLTTDDIHEVFDARGERLFTQLSGQFSLELADAPEDQWHRIESFTQLHQRFLFYQFALDAKSKMVERDFVTAILFAVVALEGVHSTLLQMRLNANLTESIADPNERAKKAEDTTNRLLRDVGFAESLDLTNNLFLTGDERLDENQLRDCKLGISIRNEVMHALAKRGQYRLKNRTNQQISDAYSNVMTVFRHFAEIVERDVQSESTITIRCTRSRRQRVF